MANRPDDFRGQDLTSPLNRIPPGKVALAINVRSYLRGGFKLRQMLTNAIYTVAHAIQSLARLNDTTPAGPGSGYTYISSDSSGNVYNNGTSVATGLSGNPVSLVPFRPNASVQPWEYIGDNAPQGAVTVAGEFACTGMIKVRSDGLSRKTGIKEPQLAPIVSTSASSTSGTDNLPANTVPWTNFGGANPSYNYGQTTNPGTGGVGAPVIIATPIVGSTVVLTVTGTATVNGSVHAPGDSGPTGANYPGDFISSPAIVVGAFTNGSGVVVALPAIGPVSIGASVTLTVPLGASQLQVGINSSGPSGFPSNSGNFTVAWQVQTSAVATVLSTLGNVTAYVWGDSPQSGPVSIYIWKNPNDVGGGTPRSASTATQTSINNSWQMDSAGGIGNNPSALVQWDTLLSNGTISGAVPLFSPAFPQSTPNTTNFNTCIVGTLFFPAGGTYTLTFVNKDQIQVGIGGGATVAGGYVLGESGQTETVVSSLPLVYVSAPSGGGGAVTHSISVTVPAQGSYQFEIDWDFWYHSGRTMVMTGSPTPGAAAALIPPLPQGVRTNVSYAYKYRASESGAQSNPSPTSTAQVTPVLDSTVTSVWSPDPQVTKVDYYRQDAGLDNFTYVATGPNDGLGGTIDGVIYNTSIVDELTDTEAAANQQMTYDDFEPVPSIDLPRSGVVTVSGGVITWVSGDHFNIRWLAGTIMLIGSPTQLPYSFIARPTSTTSVTIPGVPDGTDLAYNIAEPILAAQPLAYLFGPTDNINFTFGVGDPNRPGTLYWCKGSNLDSWPDTNQLDVTDPSEALVNGAMSGGLGVLGSIKRFWVIEPNFFNAEATVTGTVGSTWTLQDTSIKRGLYMPRCLAVEGGGNFYFRVNDGIHVSPGGGGSRSITDDDLYPLFPHEEGVNGSTPVGTPIVRNGVTIYPPDDTKPQGQKFSITGAYLAYDFIDTNGGNASLIYDMAADGWVLDLYSVGVTARASNQGVSTQGPLVGCSDGTIRMMGAGATEAAVGTVLTPAIGGMGYMTAYEYTVEYTSSATVTLTSLAVDTGNGSFPPPPVTLPSTGGLPTKYTFKVGDGKWKWLAFQFQSTDPTLAVYLGGFVISCHPWGSEGPYEPVRPFGNSGGLGGQA